MIKTWLLKPNTVSDIHTHTLESINHSGYLKNSSNSLIIFFKFIRLIPRVFLIRSFCDILLFSSIGALEIQMSVCLSVGNICLLNGHNSVIFAPRSLKFCVVVDIEVTDKLGEKIKRGVALVSIY